METSLPKFFAKPGLGSVILSLLLLVLVLAFGLYREHRMTARMDAAERAQTQANKKAYRDGVEEALRDSRRSGVSESNALEIAVSLFRNSGATDSEIEDMKKRVLTSQGEKR